MIDEKAIEHRLILILRSAASFQEKAALVVPFRKASVVMELHIIRNHEQDNAIRQAFFEHDGAVDAPVVVLERVNALESSAKPDDILERPIRRVMPTKNTRTSSATRSGGMVGQPTTSFERRFQSPPRRRTVRRRRFQNGIQPLYQRLGKGALSMRPCAQWLRTLRGEMLHFCAASTTVMRFIAYGLPTIIFDRKTVRSHA